MASDNYQETDHKTSQETRATSLLLQTDTVSCTKQQPNIRSILWKLGGINRSPNGESNRIWIRVFGHHRNQKLIPLPQRQ